jgi:bifunctional UDP-N-acetylglucosamine pyrophosphorylase/glucosamine-1-phosphate N-acetyltransferase
MPALNDIRPSFAGRRSRRVQQLARASRRPAFSSVSGAGDSAVAVILAAGLGTRMRSGTPKLLHPILGRPMLAYVVDAARAATPDRRPIVVTSPATAAIRDAFAGEVDFALQADPIGTGDAVRAALQVVPAGAVEVLVISGDVPQVQPELLLRLLAERRAARAPMALVVVETATPGNLGRVVRADDASVHAIVEARDATPAELEIEEINTGLYAFDAAWLRSQIGGIEPSRATGEIYLTHLVDRARGDGGVADLLVEDDGTLLGINDRAELADAQRKMQVALNRRLMVAGVTMADPATAWIDAEVQIASDVVLEPNVVLRGRTRIGEGTVIGAASQVFDSVIGRGCRVWASVVEQSEIGDDAEVGPFSHLRPGSSIGRGARLGNFAEVKNSRIGVGVQQHHVSYIGDADVGDRTNIGAGTITANYDGRTKHRTTIGEGVFLGVDTMIVAPISIGDGAKTGAGAVVTRDVPPGKLAVGMPARMREPRPASSEGSEPARGQPPTAGQGPASEQAADAEAAEPPPAIEPAAVAAPSAELAGGDAGSDR